MEQIFIEQKKVFIFDWDGTIFDSMKIKVETFSNVLSEMISRQINDIDLRNEIKVLYKELSGRPRREIYKAILVAFNIQQDLIDYEEFNRNLMETNKKYLEKADIFSDAVMLLEKLINNQKIVFISSSVPQEELDLFTGIKLKKELISGISDILGSSDGFGKGEKHFNYIMEKTGLGKDSMLFIGDDLSDFQLSSGAGVDFIMVDREYRFHSSDFFRVPNLTVIGDTIK